MEKEPINLYYCIIRSIEFLMSVCLSVSVLCVLCFHVKLFCWLTATVEPFLPIPPACITLSVSDSAQTPHTTVIIDIEFHSSKLPNTLNWLNVLFLELFWVLNFELKFFLIFYKMYIWFVVTVIDLIGGFIYKIIMRHYLRI